MTIVILANTTIYIALTFCAIVIFVLFILVKRAYKKRKRSNAGVVLCIQDYIGNPHFTLIISFRFVV